MMQFKFSMLSKSTRIDKGYVLYSRMRPPPSKAWMRKKTITNKRGDKVHV